MGEKKREEIEVEEQWFLDQNKIWENDLQSDMWSFEKHKLKLSKRLFSIERNCIFWLIWAYGVWKSTLLNEISKEYIWNEKVKWICFDAWEIPDRKNLWDWLLLKLLKEIDNNKIEKAKKEISWEYYSWMFFLIIFCIIISLVLAYILDEYYKSNSFLISVIIFLYPTLLWVIPIILSFYKRNPITRLSEYKELLIDSLKKSKYDKIYIVLEDIDRAGTEWIYFLETLKNFLEKENLEEIKTKLIFIVPIAEEGDCWLDKKFQSYIKCLDYYEDYVNAFDRTKFFNEVFLDGYRDEKFIENLRVICNKLAANPNPHSIREIKYMFRTINRKFVLNENREKINRQLYILFGILLYKKEWETGIYSKVIKRRSPLKFRWKLADNSITVDILKIINTYFKIDFSTMSKWLSGNWIVEYVFDSSIDKLGDVVDESPVHHDLKTINIPSFYKE